MSRDILLPSLLAVGAFAGAMFVLSEERSALVGSFRPHAELMARAAHSYREVATSPAGERQRAQAAPIASTTPIASTAPIANTAPIASTTRIADTTPLAMRAPIAGTTFSGDAAPSSTPAPNDLPRGETTHQELADVHRIPAEVIGAAEPDARAIALRQLGDAPTPSSLNTLEQTVRFDDAARNRLLAVNTLRSMAKRGDDGGRSLAILRIATADADENVATNAREAYQESEPSRSPGAAAKP